MPDRPNVLLLALDTLRADRLGCYGYPRPTSPTLDAFAAGGVLFEEFISPHIPTAPGFATMFTGKDVISHQRAMLSGPVEPDETVRPLAELLAAEGYQTAAVDSLRDWFRRGYEHFETYSWPWRQSPEEEWRRAELVTEKTLPLLERLAANARPGAHRRPFYLFLHYWDPHTPYLPPHDLRDRFYDGRPGDERDPANRSLDTMFRWDPFADYYRAWLGDVTDARYVNALYDACLCYMDGVLARLFARLDELGLAEQTLVVITADHGESLDEHDCWYDHHGLYEENIHVPLLMRRPGALPAGVRVSGLTRQQDVAPTILDHVGLGHVVERERMDGASLLPLLARPGAAARTHRAPAPGAAIADQEARGTCEGVYLTENTWMRKRGWRTRGYKLIESVGPDFHSFAPLELYDLEADPQERRNLAKSRLDIVAQLQSQMYRWLAERTAASGKPDPMSYQVHHPIKIGWGWRFGSQRGAPLGYPERR